MQGDSKGVFSRPDSIADGQTKAVRMTGKSQWTGRKLASRNEFGSTFMSGTTASAVKCSQRENYKQLKHLVEGAIREGDQKMDQLRERHQELKLQDISNRHSRHALNNDRQLSKKSFAEIKESLVTNNRIIVRIQKE